MAALVHRERTPGLGVGERRLGAERIWETSTPWCLPRIVAEPVSTLPPFTTAGPRIATVPLTPGGEL